MNNADLFGQNIIALGYGEGRYSQPNTYVARVKSVVRYADPAAWAVVDAIGRALGPLEEECAAASEQIGVLLVSEDGPKETIAAVASTIDKGFISPMRFPAATPASLIGLACIVFGFQGPTLNLTMSLRTGLPIMYTLATSWLERDVAKFVIINTYQVGTEDEAPARSVLLGQRHTGQEPKTFSIERFFDSSATMQ